MKEARVRNQDHLDKCHTSFRKSTLHMYISIHIHETFYGRLLSKRLRITGERMKIITEHAFPYKTYDAVENSIKMLYDKVF